MKTVSTSRHHAIGEDIILRENSKTRLLFRPELVDNASNKQAPVRGNFIFQVKKPSGAWEDYNSEEKLSNLKDGEGIKLLLHAEEVLSLLTGLLDYKQLYEEHGIKFGTNHYAVTSENVASVLSQLSEYQDLPLLAQKLQELKINNLQTLDTLIGVSGLQKIYAHWQQEKGNSNEEYWQQLFKKYPWILSQVFPYAVTLFGQKMYVGGKGIDNTGGKVIDFLYQKELLDNIALIEIKTPKTPLLGGMYRDNVYSISADLTGTVNQVLNYKDSLAKEYAQLLSNSSKHFTVFNPKVIIIAGNCESEVMNSEQKKSFELFRNDLRNVEIITFDELFSKIEHLVEVLKQPESLELS